jgi:hypothetical protein
MVMDFMIGARGMRTARESHQSPDSLAGHAAGTAASRAGSSSAHNRDDNDAIDARQRNMKM